MAPWLRYVLVGGVVAAAMVLSALALMAFVFSLGTRVVRVRVDVTVRSARTREPAAGCLLAFEKSPNGGFGWTRERTAADGSARHETSHSSVGSVLWPFRREQEVKLRLYLGPPPHYGTYEEREVWDVTLRFRDPRPGGEVRPRVELRRGLAHEEVLNPPAGKEWQSAGTRPLPGAPEGVGGALEVPRVRLERQGEAESYAIPFVVTLDDSQIASCRSDE